MRKGAMVRVKKRRRNLFLILLTAVLLILVVNYMPLTPALLSAVSCTDAQNNRETHFLDADAGKDLLTALQGPVVKRLPEDIETAAEMTLQLKGFPPRRYALYVTATREIYLKPPRGKQYIRSADAHFFYTHEAFQALFPWGQMPAVRLTAGAQEISPRTHEHRWQFLGWKNNWYDGMLQPMPACSENWPVLNTAEQQLLFGVDPLPDRATLQVQDPAGKTVFDAALAGRRLPTFPRNGTYDYCLSLSWQDERQMYRGQYDASFSVIMELPPEFSVPDEVVQGELLSFHFYHLPSGVKPVLELDIDYPIKFFPHEDGYVAYLPTHYGTEPGEYRMTYGLEGAPLKESTLVVRPRDFHIQHLSVAAGIVASTRNEAASAQFARYFPPSRETSAPEPYYYEPFVLPVPGRLTTEFGETRYVNEAPTSYRHSGLDIAAPTGTPVLAANNGCVTLAMDLILTGNTVVIDHGQGLFSVYYHMHELFVEAGQMVERGETIGTVGSTGFSTGPHLHFIISFYQHNLEPGYFLVGEAITYENAAVHLQRQ